MHARVRTESVPAHRHRRDTAYLDALLRTFEQALKATGNLTGKVQNGFLNRLDRVWTTGHHLTYGVGDDMDVLFFRAGGNGF
jgi:hypothetical protein